MWCHSLIKVLDKLGHDSAIIHTVWIERKCTKRWKKSVNNFLIIIKGIIMKMISFYIIKLRLLFVHPDALIIDYGKRFWLSSNITADLKHTRGKIPSVFCVFLLLENVLSLKTLSVSIQLNPCGRTVLR